MKYVEAMLQPVSFNSNMPKANAMERTITALLEHFAAFEESSEAAAEATPQQPSIVEAFKLAKAVNEAWDNYDEALSEHECENGLMVPVGDVTPLADQLYRRNGFLPADEVAIIKLSDLMLLMAESDALKEIMRETEKVS